MHFLILVLSALAGLAVWYMRLKAIGSAAKDIGKFAQRVRSAPRKFAFMNRAGKTGLKAVREPMEAGAILLVLMAGARANRALAPRDKEAVFAQLSRVFDLDSEDASDLVSHATWMVRDVELVSGVVLRMTQIVKQSPGISAPELVDLHEMLVAIAELDGQPDEEQVLILDLYRQKVGLTV